jgi:hypothetical protein
MGFIQQHGCGNCGCCPDEENQPEWLLLHVPSDATTLPEYFRCAICDATAAEFLAAWDGALRRSNCIWTSQSCGPVKMNIGSGLSDCTLGYSKIYHDPDDPLRMLLDIYAHATNDSEEFLFWQGVKISGMPEETQCAGCGRFAKVDGCDIEDDPHPELHPAIDEIVATAIFPDCVADNPCGSCNECGNCAGCSPDDEWVGRPTSLMIALPSFSCSVRDVCLAGDAITYTFTGGMVELKSVIGAGQCWWIADGVLDWEEKYESPDEGRCGASYTNHYTANVQVHRLSSGRWRLFVQIPFPPELEKPDQGFNGESVVTASCCVGGSGVMLAVGNAGLQSGCPDPSKVQWSVEPV